MKYIFLIIIMLVFSACIPAKNGSNAEQTNANISDEQIAFLTFKIYKSIEKNANEIQLINKNIVAGKIKKDSQARMNYENCLEFQIYINGEFMDSIKIEHPLYKFVEYFDDMEFKSQIIELDEQEFYIRLLIKKDATQIKIIEKLQNNMQTISIMNL